MQGRLTEETIAAFEPGARPYKRADGAGLYVEVFPDGAKRWRMQYSIEGRRRVFGIGVWPKVSLTEARERHAEARRQVDQGADPVELRRARRLARDGEPIQTPTFGAAARDWLALNAPQWGAGNVRNVTRRLEQYLIPAFGERTLDAIEPADVLALARRIETAGHSATARRVVGIADRIFQRALITGAAASNPAAAIRDAIGPSPQGGAGPTADQDSRTDAAEPARMAAYLAACEQYQGDPATRTALQLTPLLLLRSGELRALKWTHLDLDQATLRFPVKDKAARIVPLARQARKLLKGLKEAVRKPGTGPIFTGRDKTRPISEATLAAAMRRMGGDCEGMTAHYWRRNAALVLHRMGYAPHVINAQLGRTGTTGGPWPTCGEREDLYLTERRAMMQVWADHLDGIEAEHAGLEKFFE